MALEADRAAERPRFSGYPLSLGVASGAPLPDGVVPWTRLAPEPLWRRGRRRAGGRGWEVADDEAAGEVSPVGRTLAAPAARERPERLRFGLGSCQHFEHGFHAAHRHLTSEDLDVMVFVGDYIYEGAGRAGDVRRL